MKGDNMMCPKCKIEMQEEGDPDGIIYYCEKCGYETSEEYIRG